MAIGDNENINPALIELTKEYAKQLEAASDAQRRVAEQLGETISKTDELANKQERIISLNNQRLSILNKTKTERGREIASIKKQLEEETKLDAHTKEALDARAGLLERINSLSEEDIQNQRTSLQVQNARIKGSQEDIANAKGLANQMANLLGVNTSYNKSLLETSIQIATNKEVGAAFGDQLKENLSIQNVLMSAIQKVAELTILYLEEQDRAISSFKKASGAGAAYNKVIVDSHLEMRTFGFSIEEVSRVTNELRGGMVSFSGMTKEAQENVNKTVLSLERFSVTAATSVSMLNLLTSGLGMSSNQAQKVSKDMFALSNALELPPEIIFTQFSQAEAQLSAHGKGMIDVFEGMAAAAKATGAEFNTLLGFVGQFDTFSKGAQAVGKMNAVLGGPYLNTVQMLNTTEDERIRLTLRALEASGKSFASMDKFNRIAFANAAGITNMAEANKLFNTSTEAYELQRMRAKAASISQKEFERVTRNALSVFEKFRQIIKNLAVDMSFLLEPLGEAADYILELQKKYKDFEGVAVAASLVIITAVSGAAIAIGKSLGVALSGVVGSLGALGAAGFKGVLIFMGIAVGIERIGAGIGKAATGISFFMDAFTSLINISGAKLDKFIDFLYQLGPAGFVAGAGLTSLLNAASTSPGIETLPRVIATATPGSGVTAPRPAAPPGTTASPTVMVDPKLTAVLQRNADILEKIEYRLNHPITPVIELDGRKVSKELKDAGAIYRSATEVPR